MRFSYVASALLSYAAIVAAQNQTVQVQVGAEANSPGGIFQFNPSNVNATAGSTITFVFSGNPGNHSITQSTFQSPCQPAPGGFDSGFVFIPQGLSSGNPTFNLTITDDTHPIWFYCKQLAPSPHCRAGMVGAINAPGAGSNTFQAFQQAAVASSGNPGQGANGALVGSGASASDAPGPLTGGASGFGVPTSGAAAGGSSSSSSAPPSSSSTSPSSGSGSSSDAMTLVVNAVSVILAAVMGITLA
ncbi:hypothetical protein DENSPDRAFT_856337 [Dentipellis sp. KUC8613]|nr:hypothetical protein DENSPDRAFT_856337 [Dentipellis sp. KUC8613]